MQKEKPSARGRRLKIEEQSYRRKHGEDALPAVILCGGAAGLSGSRLAGDFPLNGDNRCSGRHCGGLSYGAGEALRRGVQPPCGQCCGLRAALEGAAFAAGQKITQPAENCGQRQVIARVAAGVDPLTALSDKAFGCNDGTGSGAR